MSGPKDSQIRQARSSEGRDIATGLAEELSRLAREMQADQDPSQLLDRIVHAAVSDIPSAAHAGVTMVSGARERRLTTGAKTDDVVAEVDAIQFGLRQGPCVQSSEEHETVRSDDLSHEDRWPEFAAGAAALGIRSMLSVQLFVERENFGALNLYATEPHAFGREDEDMAMMLASHAGVAIAALRGTGHLRTALDSRDVIGQAKGILMERYHLTAQQAFDLLVVASQNTHAKLREIALELTETGELPVREHR